jgi:hypothetical protein
MNRIARVVLHALAAIIMMRSLKDLRRLVAFDNWMDSQVGQWPLESLSLVSQTSPGGYWQFLTIHGYVPYLAQILDYTF